MMRMTNKQVLIDNNVDIENALNLWGDFETYNESLKEFRNSLDEKVKNLNEFKDKNDLENYSILVHSMKSESRYLGFNEQGEVFYSHELKSKENNIDFIKNEFNNLKNTILKMEDIIDNYLGEEKTKKKIIIADDSHLILNYLEKILNKNEFEILPSSDGNEALSYIASNKVYALLLDLNMPGVNGFEVLDYLKDNNMIDNFPIVIITGNDDAETVKKTFSYPILDMLKKPFNEKNIEQVLEKIKRFYNE